MIQPPQYDPSVGLPQVVRKYKILDATAYLLERVGDIKEAFELIMQVWKREMKDTNERFSQNANVTQG